MNTNTYFVLNCNVLALFTFYALPSGGKLKDMVVHYAIEIFFCSYNSYFVYEKKEKIFL